MAAKETWRGGTRGQGRAAGGGRRAVPARGGGRVAAVPRFPGHHRGHRRRSAAAGSRSPVRPGRPRRAAAGRRRLRGRAAAAPGRLRRPGHLPDRPGHRGGQGGRAEPGRRRLHDQAVRPRGAGGPGADRAAPDHAAGSPGAGAAAGPVLRFADLELDLHSYEVRRDGHPIELSPTEFRLLRYLMLNPGRVLTRAQLLDHVWDYDFRGSSTVVSTYVAYLRRKLARYGPDLIHTQRAVGYSLGLPRSGDTDDH